MLFLDKGVFRERKTLFGYNWHSYTRESVLETAQSTLGISFTISLLQQKGGHSETLLNECIAHSNSVDLLLSNNASDWLSGHFDNKNQ